MKCFGCHRELEVGDQVNPSEGQESSQLAIVKMERDWLLSAWAAACGVPHEQAEADMLAWTTKWRPGLLAEGEESRG